MGEKQKPWHRRTSKVVRSVLREAKDVERRIAGVLEVIEEERERVEAWGWVDEEFAEERRRRLEEVGSSPTIEELEEEYEQLQIQHVYLLQQADILPMLPLEQQLLYEHLAFEKTCQLVTPDFAVVTEELLAYFERYPDHIHHRLHWRQFEEFIASTFQKLGWETELGPGSGDGGVDLRLVQKSQIGELLILVQAKKYSPKRKISLETVQALYGAVEAEQASKGVLVTTSEFLPSAQKFAEQRRHRIFLASPREIASWLKQAIA